MSNSTGVSSTYWAEDVVRASREKETPRKCVSLVEDDGTKVNYIDSIGQVEGDFLIVTEDDRLVKRIPLENIREWRNRDDYFAQGWRWNGS